MIVRKSHKTKIKPKKKIKSHKAKVKSKKNIKASKVKVTSKKKIIWIAVPLVLIMVVALAFLFWPDKAEIQEEEVAESVKEEAPEDTVVSRLIGSLLDKALAKIEEAKNDTGQGSGTSSGSSGGGSGSLVPGILTIGNLSEEEEFDSDGECSSSCEIKSYDAGACLSADEAPSGSLLIGTCSDGWDEQCWCYNVGCEDPDCLDEEEEEDPEEEEEEEEEFYSDEQCAASCEIENYDTGSCLSTEETPSGSFLIGTCPDEWEDLEDEQCWCYNVDCEDPDYANHPLCLEEDEEEEDDELTSCTNRCLDMSAGDPYDGYATTAMMGGQTCEDYADSECISMGAGYAGTMSSENCCCYDCYGEAPAPEPAPCEDTDSEGTFEEQLETVGSCTYLGETKNDACSDGDILLEGSCDNPTFTCELISMSCSGIFGEGAYCDSGVCIRPGGYMTLSECSAFTTGDYIHYELKESDVECGTYAIYFCNMIGQNYLGHTWHAANCCVFGCI